MCGSGLPRSSRSCANAKRRPKSQSEVAVTQHDSSVESPGWGQSSRTSEATPGVTSMIGAVLKRSFRRHHVGRYIISPMRVGTVGALLVILALSAGCKKRFDGTCTVNQDCLASQK